MCVGGWLHSQERWPIIERRWSERVEYEQRQSSKKGALQISRFHASDCSNYRGEYEGWTASRQKLFFKRLTQIIADSKPWGIAHACAFDDLTSRFPSERKKAQKRLYRLCMYRCLMDVCQIVENNFPGQPVTVRHDHGFNEQAQKAFLGVRPHDHLRSLVSTTPMKWRDCIALQPADLIAYESLKACGRHRNNDNQVRRSLQRIVGSHVPLYMSYTKPTLFDHLKEKGAQFRSDE